MKFFAYSITTLFLFLLSGIVLFFYGLWHFGKNLPDYKELSKYNPKVVTRVHAGNGALLSEYAIENRVFVPINVIPKKLINAFLSAEDKDFYNHFGLDIKATLRAVVTNIKNIGSGKRLIGASTITQQVAKNFLLSSEVSYERKIKEAILAIRIERAFSKNQILELYLNEIYLGFKSYGVAAAALNYFDKSLDNLNIAEMAFLAALPKAPNNYNPLYKIEQATIRRNWVLHQIYKNGYIKKEIEIKERNKPIKIRKSSGTDTSYAPYFTEEVRKTLSKNKKIGSKLYTNGYSVRTTLDPFMQVNADDALINGLESLDKRQGWRGSIQNLDLSKMNLNETLKILNNLQKNLPPQRIVVVVNKIQNNFIEIRLPKGDIGKVEFKNISWVRPQTIKKNKKNKFNIYLGPRFKKFEEFLKVGDVIVVKQQFNRDKKHYLLSQIPEVNGAIVVLDPNTGRVLAMSGGYNFNQSEFNRATQAKRQPGSAFKPFVYLAGLENNYKPTDLIQDAPLAYEQCEGCPKWKPANYTKKFYGPSPLRLGIEKSRNLMTARLAIKLIEEEKLSLIQKFAFNNKVNENKLYELLESGASYYKIANYFMIDINTAKGFLRNYAKPHIIQKYAKLFGINQNLPPYLSMSLGAGETTLLELTNAYGMIVNGGKKITPTLIDRIQDRRGKTILKHDERECENCNVGSKSSQIPPVASRDSRKQIISSASAYQMASMLKGAVDRGTGVVIKSLKRNLAGKTGTTNSNADAWFIGFSSDLVVGVFVGFDNPRSLGFKETGSSVAAPIFKKFMKEVLKNKPDIPFRRPPGIKLVMVNAKTGIKAKSNDKNSILEAFKPGQLPSLSINNNLVDLKKSEKNLKNLSPLY
ncbi:penicillin-binding protein 1A [Pseudomonadota bacterium]|nr:penicillin-binding protein 1A [Alphaproteobacteria bacterium]MDC1355974.1 penicillin-binding protein 1A [Pseudomonadota bacterium]